MTESRVLSSYLCQGGISFTTVCLFLSFCLLVAVHKYYYWNFVTKNGCCIFCDQSMEIEDREKKEFRDPEDPDGDQDHSQNLITYSFTNFSHILKISSKSLHRFLSYLSLKINFMDTEDPDSDPNDSQNLITSSFYHFRHILKILSKSVHNFLIYLVHKQTDKQTAEVITQKITYTDYDQ